MSDASNNIKPICGKTGKGLAVSFDGAATELLVATTTFGSTLDNTNFSSRSSTRSPNTLRHAGLSLQNRAFGQSDVNN